MTIGTVIFACFYRKLAAVERAHVPLRSATRPNGAVTEDVPPAVPRSRRSNRFPSGTGSSHFW